MDRIRGSDQRFISLICRQLPNAQLLRRVYTKYDRLESKIKSRELGDEGENSV